MSMPLLRAAVSLVALFAPAAAALASSSSDERYGPSVAESLTAVAPAGFLGEYWDEDRIVDLTDALGIISADDARATFIATAIDYPAGGTAVLDDSTRLEDFLGFDAATLSGSHSRPIGGSVFRFTGMVDLGGGSHSFAVGSDDGFRLSIGGDVIAEFTGQRSFAVSSAVATVAAGPQPLELIFFENAGVTGIEFRVDGAIADTALLVSAVPEPGQSSMFLAGMGLLALVARSRRAAR